VGFEEREKLMVFYERARRAHARQLFPPGGVHQDLPPELIDDIDAFCDPFLKVCDDIERCSPTTASSSSATSISAS
jgi:NADH-quinone oxidoreductase subunit D